MKALVALVALTTIATAADLTATVTPLVSPARPGAPEWVEVVMTAPGGSLREGVLEIETRRDGETLHTYRTHALAFAGSQKYRFLLPASTGSLDDRVRDWVLHFIEREQRIPLGTFPAPDPSSARSSVILASVRAPGDRNTQPQWQALRIGNLQSTEGNVRIGSINTPAVLLESADLPTDPLGYCAFDAVQLEGMAFAALREKQLTALAQWVEAGGRLCVTADHPLSAAHLDFLNGLASADPNIGTFELYEGNLLKTPRNKDLTFVRASFGRLVINRQRFATESEASKEATTFLWGLSPEVLPQEEKIYVDYMRQYQTNEYLLGMTADVLMPKQLRLVPLWKLGLMFAAFIVIVGPVEYWVFGKRRWRALTWVAFPCTALVLTVLTIRLAQRHMGTSNHQSDLVIHDIGPRGKVVRETRLRLTLPSRNLDTIHEVENAICTPERHRRQDIRYHFSSRPREEAVPAFAGQFPTRYTVSLPLTQWHPQVYRFLSIQPAEDTSGVMWEGFSPDKLKARWAGLHAEEFAGDRNESIDFFWKGNSRLAEFTDLLPPHLRVNFAYRHHRYDSPLALTVSPKGFTDLDDLPCLEGKFAEQTLLQVTKKKGHTIHMWRRLFLH